MDALERAKRSRELRRQATEAEIVLWRRLRNRQVMDWKWRRQQPIGPYFADFACKEASLVVELDGSQHLEADGREYDQERTAHMAAEGWRVLRFTNRDAMQKTDSVLDTILRALEEDPHPIPLPGREREPTDSASEGVKPNRYNWRHVSPVSGKRTRQL